MKDPSQASDKKQTFKRKLHTHGWVSLNGFAVLIGVAYPTALRMADRGDVKTIPVGGIRRVYADEVFRFLSNGNSPDKE